jgi:DNA-binding HxlR family transcriptional regulator
MLEIKENKKKYRAAGDCPITATIDVIGGKWKPIIIWVLMDGPKRFGELHKSMPGIALKVLSRQLKEMEADDIVVRKAFPEVPPRVEYSLSEKGKSLTDIMESLAIWSRLNIPAKVMQAEMA